MCNYDLTLVSPFLHYARKFIEFFKRIWKFEEVDNLSKLYSVQYIICSSAHTQHVNPITLDQQHFCLNMIIDGEHMFQR